MSVHSLTKQDAGRSINVVPGDLIRLEVEDISTSGYRWTVDMVDRSILDVLRSDYFPQPGIGGGGQRTFIFTVKALGRTAIHLKLWREWEGDSSTIERVDIEIIVT